MKIGVITFHFVNNYGGILQAYALQKFLNSSLNEDTFVIDYRNRFICFTDTIRLLPITKKPKEIISGIKTISLRKIRRNKFSIFTNSYIPLSPRKYYSSRSLRTRKPSADFYICGSDQIWNPFISFGVCGAYFCDFEKESNKKISYAPSFGKTNFTSHQKNKIFKKISRLGAISVREEESVKMLSEQYNLLATQHIDPVFLLASEEWEFIAKQYSGDTLPEKYILLYMMQPDSRVYEYAKKMKELTDLPILEISRYGYKTNFVDTVLIDVGPDEFLGLIKNARYVCTNSFHGLAFSIIFNKELCLIPSIRFSGRMTNLLSIFDIKNINISSLESLSEINDLLLKYSAEYTSQKIYLERKRSFDYLKSHIDNLK